jgi:hypothetical protein
MGKRKSPQPSPLIAQAAVQTTDNGAAYLDFMKQQAAITNQWAAEDRAQYQKIAPVRDRLIQDAQEWDSPERIAARADENRGAVSANIAMGQQMQQRQMAAMGVSPNSGRSAAIADASGIQNGLALAGASNLAGREVRAEGDAKRANVMNIANGLAANAGTNIGLSNGAISNGYSGMGNALNQSANLYQTDYSNRAGQVQMQNQQNADLWGGVGSLVGLAFGSDEATKTKIKKASRSLLDAVDNMPVKDWTYKTGEGDGGRHIGPMAQDFKKATGMGDGKTINVIDALGTLTGAVQELNAKVKAMSGSKSLPTEAMEKETKAHEKAEGPKKRAQERRMEARGLSDDMKDAA